jgi:hypothetical protein
MEAAARLVNRPVPPQPAAVVLQVVPVGVQRQGLRVSGRADAAEAEAARVARQVVSMPAVPARRPGALRLPSTMAGAQAPPVAGPGGGESLPESLRSDMEGRFGADFSAVRIHRDEQAAQASQQLNAAAFTVGNRIHFGAGRWQPDSAEGRELIAHELTHTIQQGAAARQERAQMPPVTVAGGTAVHRLGIGDALDYFARHAEAIPGFRLFTLVLGRNPVNMQAVARTPANLLRAAVELMPGGVLITRALDNHGIIDQASAWVQGRIDALGMVAGSIRQAIDDFLAGLRWRDIFDLGGVWARARRIVSEPIARISAFIRGLAGDILTLIRDAILLPLAGLARRLPGWDLLCAVLGRDPVSGQAVPRSADTLIGGFMRLIGQEEVWRNIQRANAIDRAFAWFQGAVAGVRATVAALPQLFIDTLRGLGIADLVMLPQTFAKVGRVFGSFAVNFIQWAGVQVWRLLEIIVDVVAPGVMPYLRRAAGAFRSILANPVGFVGNLVRAGVLGFRNFAANIVSHLRAALIGWLTGTLAGAGVYIPQAFTLQEIVRFVLSVLGLTWQNLRQRLVRSIGERAVVAMETGFDLVVRLVRDGPAAVWQQIAEGLANLREMVVEQVLAFVRNRIVVAAVTRLVSMLNPAGAFVQAIIAIYNTIMFFVERLRQIAQVAASFIDSIAAIASGAIAAAAGRVERTMAGLLTLVISFLARLAGLGRVSDAINNVIARIRAPVDRALDRVVDWLVRQGRRFLGAVQGAAGRVTEWWRQRKPFSSPGGESHSLYFLGDERNPRPMVASRDPQPVEVRLDRFLAAAQAPDASRRKRDAQPLISATRGVLRANADDPRVVSNLRILFGIFDDPSTPRVTRLQHRTMSLGGDTVGVGMSIDWLNDAYRRAHPGSPPQSGAQATLMGKLETSPGQSSPDKYIRGHLLNEHIGGPGSPLNLFPITGNANSRHLHSTESRVKRWVDVPANYVFYEVTVDGISSSLASSNVRENWVNATFNCRAVLKDEDGTEKESYLTAITSTYRVRNEAQAFRVD